MLDSFCLFTVFFSGGKKNECPTSRHVGLNLFSSCLPSEPDRQPSAAPLHLRPLHLRLPLPQHRAPLQPAHTPRRPSLLLKGNLRHQNSCTLRNLAAPVGGGGRGHQHNDISGLSAPSLSREDTTVGGGWGWGRSLLRGGNNACKTIKQFDDYFLFDVNADGTSASQ